MNSNSIANMEIEMFNKKINNFIKISEQYSKRNVDVKGNLQDQKIKNKLSEKFGFSNNTDYLQVEFFAEIPKDILIELYDIIQSFVQICETHKKSNNEILSYKEKSFLSGVKFINNIVKHKEKDFEITDLIVPDFKVEPEGVYLHDSGKITAPINQDSFRLAAKWTPVKKQIYNEMHNKKQLKNYRKHLQDHDVIDMVISAKEIINRFDMN